MVCIASKWLRNNMLIHSIVVVSNDYEDIGHT